MEAVSKKIISSILLIYGAIYSLILICRFNTFSLGALDLSNYTQAIWKISNFQTPIVTPLGIHTLVDHFCLLWYPLALLFKIIPHPYFLLILHTAAITATAWVLHDIAFEIVKNRKIAFFFMLAYLFSEYTQRVLFSPIHPDSFAGLLISLALLFMIKEKWSLFLLFFILSLSSNEDIGLYFVMVGVYLAFVKGRKAIGGAVGIFSLLWLIFIFKFKPFIGADTTGHLGRFSLLGNSLSEILKNVILRPWIIPLNLLAHEKLATLSRLFLQTGFTSVFSLGGLLLLSAPLLFKSLTNHAGMYRYWDHYSMVVLPFLWMAAALGMKNIVAGKILGNKLKEPAVFGERLALAVLVVNIFIQGFLPFSPLSFRFDWNQLRQNTESREGLEIIKTVPKDASVLTQENISPVLAMRQDLRIIHYFNQVPNGIPLWQMDYIVFNRNSFKGNWLGKDLMAADYYFAHSESYSVFNSKGSWIVYKRLLSHP